MYVGGANWSTGKQHCLMTWIQQDSSKGLCPMCRQSESILILIVFPGVFRSTNSHQNLSGSKKKNNGLNDLAYLHIPSRQAFNGLIQGYPMFLFKFLFILDVSLACLLLLRAKHCSCWLDDLSIRSKDGIGLSNGAIQCLQILRNQ
jgi:hypothetical protein